MIPRTLTNLTFIPLIILCGIKRNNHALIFSGTMIFSFMFHLKEETRKDLLISYWHWLGLDHFFSILAIIATCCFLVDQKFNAIIWIIICMDGFLNIYFCSIPNGKYLDYKNIGVFLIFGIFVLLNYKKIVLNKIHQFCLILGYLIGVYCLSLNTTLGHCLWHVFMSLTTFVLYFLQFRIMKKNQDKSLNHLFIES